VESSAPNLSLLDFVFCLLVALEHGSVAIEETLLVDHTLTIKSVRAYKIRQVFSFSIVFKNSVPLPGFSSPFIAYSFNNTHENIISTESIRNKKTLCSWAPSLTVLQQKRILCTFILGCSLLINNFMHMFIHLTTTNILTHTLVY